MATGGNFQVDTAAMATVLGDIAGVLQQLDGAVRATGSLSVPTGCFGGLGSAAGAGSDALHTQAGAALVALHAALEELNRRLQRSLTGYRSADSAVAAALLALTPAQRQGLPLR